MRSPRGFKNKGISLVEVVVVISLILMFTALTVPVSEYFLGKQALESFSANVLGLMREAQRLAIRSRSSGEFGVFISSSSRQAVLFKGSSYAGRDVSYDKTVVIPAGLDLVPEEAEVNFIDPDGRPEGILTLTISRGSIGNVIEVSAVGRIMMERGVAITTQ